MQCLLPCGTIEDTETDLCHPVTDLFIESASSPLHDCGVLPSWII